MVDLNLEAETLIGESIYGQDNYDKARILECAEEAVHTTADNLCIYTSRAEEIISEYERDPNAPDESESEFSADRWREAMRCWAFDIASGVLYREVSKVMKEVDGLADDLCDAVSEVDSEEAPTPDELRVSIDCIHGWAAHDKEEDGVCYWTSRQLEGMNSLGVDAGPFWLFYTWTPKD